MSYQPAFTETFVALLAVVLWTRWLDGRGAPGWTRWLPWATGLCVALAQALAISVLLSEDSTQGPMLLAGRWLGMGSCVASLLLLAALTVRSLARGRSS